MSNEKYRVIKENAMSKFFEERNIDPQSSDGIKKIGGSICGDIG